MGIILWDSSSAVEHRIDMAVDTGSNPVCPTIFIWVGMREGKMILKNGGDGKADTKAHEIEHVCSQIHPGDSLGFYLSHDPVGSKIPYTWLSSPASGMIDSIGGVEIRIGR